MNPYFQPIQLKEELQVKIESFCRIWENRESISIQTSGSTGNPKEITFSNDQFVVSARKTIAFFQLNTKSKALLCLSPDTIGGKMMLVRALVGKYRLFIINPSLDPFADIDEQIDFIALVPAQLSFILKCSSSLSKLKKVKNILIGGADIPEDLIEQLREHKITAYQSYGMTETISHVALRKIGKSIEYHALPGIHFSCEDGCLAIHYPEIQPNVILTRDEVDLVDELTFRWKGRADFVVNTGGKKIHPEELEKRLSPFISGRFILSSIPHPIWGEALVILSEQQITIQKKDLIKHFTTAEIPKFAQMVPMILTANGKIQRKLTFEQTVAHAWISL